jgi:hypothetical protein
LSYAARVSRSTGTQDVLRRVVVFVFVFVFVVVVVVVSSCIHRQLIFF